MKKCIGFGKYEGWCNNPSGSSHSKLWCQRCDDLRMAHLDKRFAELQTLFKGDKPRTRLNS